MEPNTNAVLIKWLNEHSGIGEQAHQCEKHPAIRAMTSRQQLAALQADAGIHVSRQWLTLMCRRLDIERQGTSLRISPMTTARQRAKGRERWHRWFERLQRDPERLRAYRARHRKA